MQLALANRDFTSAVVVIFGPVGFSKYTANYSRWQVHVMFLNKSILVKLWTVWKIFEKIKNNVHLLLGHVLRCPPKTKGVDALRMLGRSGGFPWTVKLCSVVAVAPFNRETGNCTFFAGVWTLWREESLVTMALLLRGGRRFLVDDDDEVGVEVDWFWAVVVGRLAMVASESVR